MSLNDCCDSELSIYDVTNQQIPNTFTANLHETKNSRPQVILAILTEHINWKVKKAADIK
jgi:hypothetical protein